MAADIIGHNKPTMTYGLYGGETRMDLRASTPRREWRLASGRGESELQQSRPIRSAAANSPSQAAIRFATSRAAGESHLEFP